MPLTKNPTPTIGKAVSGGTSGSILFVDSSGNLQQVNAQLFWDATNNRLGVTMTTPHATMALGAGVGTKLALFDSGVSSMYGFGIQSSIMQMFCNAITDRVGIGYGGSSSAFVETLTVKGSSVGVGNASPNSPFQVAGPIATAITASAKTGAYSIASTDSTITGDTTGSAFTITLPTAVSISGRQYTIKRISASANNLTIGTTSSQTIDGATTKTLASQYAAITVQSDGVNWQIIAQMGTVT